MIRLKNSQNGLSVEVQTGFSWTSFFFGFLVPLFRGMYGYAGIVAVASIFTLGFSSLYFPFVINKAQVKMLLEKGYKPASLEDAKQIEALQIGYIAEEVHARIAA